MQIHHIGLEVQDIFCMERFYRLVFGFSLDYRYESRTNKGLKTVFLSRGPTRLELLARDRAMEALAPAASQSVTSWGHFSLDSGDVESEWLTINDRAATAAYASSRWSPPRTTGDGYREAVIWDPEGNCIELCQNLRPNTRPSIKAIIIDFDTTLADCESNQFLSASPLSAEFGFGCDERDREKNATTRMDELFQDEALRNIRKFPAMVRLLQLVSGSGMPVTLAMGTQERFPAPQLSENIARRKPAPDCLLRSADRLGMPAESCLAIVDSAPGIEAALRAGMPCLAIPSVPHTPLDPNYALADFLVAEGMEALDPQKAWVWILGFPKRTGPEC